MKFLIIFFLGTQVVWGQINIDSLITLSRAKDNKSKELLGKMIYQNSTVEIKKGARGYSKVDSKINTYEAKGIETIPLLQTSPGYIKTKINGLELFFSSKDYVNNSISSPLIDTITMYFINNAEKVKSKGIDKKLFAEITKLTYEFETMVKTDTTFESKTSVSLKRTDHKYLGKEGKYYKFLIPSIIDQPVYVSKRAIDNKILAFYKEIVKKFVPSDHINFFSPDNPQITESSGKFVSSFSSENYSTVTHKNGNSYITKTTYNGKTTTSIYTLDY